MVSLVRPLSSFLKLSRVHIQSRFRSNVPALKHHEWFPEIQQQVVTQASKTSTTQILKATVPSNDQHVINTVWTDGAQRDFPLAWLRYNCRCPKCYDPTPKSRMISLADVDINAGLKDVKVEEQGHAVNCIWTDDHESLYKADWLKARGLDDSQVSSYQDLYRLPKILWDTNTLQDKIPVFDFTQLMEDDVHLLEWLTAVEMLGAAVISNADLQIGQVEKVGNRVGYLSLTYFGNTFEVKTKPGWTNASYSTYALPLHTDLAYTGQPPCVQLLHCIRQAKGTGGINTISDGFNGAEVLKNTHPEFFNLLTTHEVAYKDLAVEGFKIHSLSRHKIISLDGQGQYSEIRWSDHGCDDCVNHLPADLVLPFLKAANTYLKILYDPLNCITYRMKEGDILCLDNHRVLHGRTAYDETSEGERFLEGGYIGWTEMKSKRRVLSGHL